MSKQVKQIAALPIRRDDKGNVRVLMITSRETGRWVMPKGWEMDGKKPWAAAEIEALEEAGAIGHIAKVPIGTYEYDKVQEVGSAVRCRVHLYPMVVRKLKRNWKERAERKRRWFSPRTAAKAVQEPELTALLLQIDKKKNRKPFLNELLKVA